MAEALLQDRRLLVVEDEYTVAEAMELPPPDSAGAGVTLTPNGRWESS